MAFRILIGAFLMIAMLDLSFCNVCKKNKNKNYDEYPGDTYQPGKGKGYGKPASYNNKHASYYGKKEPCKPASCLDIYNADCRSLSGEYTIYSGNQALRVYCSFEGDYVYTFISRISSGTTFDISTLYSTSEFVQVRSLNGSGAQNSVIMENLSTDQMDLAIELGSTPSAYQGPSTSKFGQPNNPNTGLFPYLFLGFLPISLTNAKTTQGYRAADTDWTFNNCDENPNSYLAFYFDPNSGSYSRVGNTKTYMRQWIINSTPLSLPDYMPVEYYMEFEFHMGGCGGFITSESTDVLAALGLAQALPVETCTEPTCHSVQYEYYGQ